MRRNMPELMAVPLVLGGLGLLFAILAASEGGLWVWVAVGVLILAALLGILIVTMRRPRDAHGFEGRAAPAGDGVHRVLLVVDSPNTTADLDGLPPGRYLVVAPAISSRVARWTGDEHAYRQAEENVRATVRAVKGLSFDATGRVGAHDPLQAADEALRAFAADEIVFALHPGGEGDWLEQGVVDAARARYGVPVRQLDTLPTHRSGPRPGGLPSPAQGSRNTS